MNEVNNIHVGGQQFTIDVDARHKLKQYLDAITKVSGVEKADLLQEVEARVAELLTERGCVNGRVVVPKDIDYIIEQLGEPAEFQDDHDEVAADTTTKPKTIKRLYRNSEEGMVAGVSAGLGDYFGIDPLIFRLVFIATTFLGGSGIIAYVVLWILAPEAKTVSEKLAMKGEPVTLRNLRASVDEADIAGAARKAGNSAQRTIKRLVEAVLQLAVGITGVIFTVLALIVLLSIVSAVSIAVLDKVVVAGVAVFPLGTNDIVALGAAAVALSSLFIGLLLFGIAIIRRKWHFSSWGLVSLVSVFLLASCVAAVTTPDVVYRVRDRVTALRHEQVITVDAFDSAELKGHDTQFEYVPDSQSYVRYIYQGTLATAPINTSISNRKLTIDTTKLAKSPACSMFCINSYQVLRVEIHGPAINDVSISGNADVFESLRPLTQASITLRVASESTASIDDNTLSNVRLVANAQTDRVLSTDIVPGGGASDGVTIMSGGDSPAVFNTQNVDVSIETNRRCTNDQPMVLINGAGNHVTLNGRSIVPASIPAPTDTGEMAPSSTDQNCVAAD